MLRYLLQHNVISAIPIAVLILFFTIIAGVFVWMLRPGSRELYKQIARSAIESGGKNEK
jgi:cbb3-type cytochrome oxidase subunit 3